MDCEAVLLVVSVVAGVVASITGFGIGSLITPVLSFTIGTKLAVATVSVPHLIATAIRFWMLRSHLDKRIFFSFGLTSAAGGLIGALFYANFDTPVLTLVFGAILLFSGVMGAANLSRRLKLSGISAWIAGGLSGFLGGMVGNQGGIRSAALLGFKIQKESFVATATAVGLIVDSARLPVYFWSQGNDLLENGKWIFLATIGVVLGTFLGTKFLRQIKEQIFQRVVSFFIIFLGLLMLLKGMQL